MPSAGYKLRATQTAVAIADAPIPLVLPTDTGRGKDESIMVSIKNTGAEPLYFVMASEVVPSTLEIPAGGTRIVGPFAYPHGVPALLSTVAGTTCNYDVLGDGDEW